MGGLDFKSTTTDLDSGGESFFSAPAEIAQLVFGYYGVTQQGSVNSASWAVNLFVGLEDFSTFNNNASFNTIRVGSTTDYVYARGDYQRQWQLPRGFRLVGRLTGQLASARLQPSEQLGVSGFTSVRGYDMREVVGDSGVISNLELRTRPICIGCSSVRRSSQLQFLSFFDYASAHNIRAIPPEDANIDISSVGAGFRYNLGQSVALRADYGWQLKSLPNSDRSSRFHIGMTVFR